MREFEREEQRLIEQEVKVKEKFMADIQQYLVGYLQQRGAVMFVAFPHINKHSDPDDQLALEMLNVARVVKALDLWDDTDRILGFMEEDWRNASSFHEKNCVCVTYQDIVNLYPATHINDTPIRIKSVHKFTSGANKLLTTVAELFKHIPRTLLAYMNKSTFDKNKPIFLGVTAAECAEAFEHCSTWWENGSLIIVHNMDLERETDGGNSTYVRGCGFHDCKGNVDMSEEYFTNDANLNLLDDAVRCFFHELFGHVKAYQDTHTGSPPEFREAGNFFEALVAAGKPHQTLGGDGVWALRGIVIGDKQLPPGTYSSVEFWTMSRDYSSVTHNSLLAHLKSPRVHVDDYCNHSSPTRHKKSNEFFFERKRKIVCIDKPCNQLRSFNKRGRTNSTFP